MFIVNNDTGENPEITWYTTQPIFVLVLLQECILM
jgi:hypothetical protein